jgi:protein involved in polysaccharide export with SLBB domain
MVERAQIPACSQEVLASAGQESFLEEQRITVEVAGAVREPGVWQLAIGSRQADAVEKAGGYSQRADRTFVLKNMNLAQPLEDGQNLQILKANLCLQQRLGVSFPSIRLLPKTFKHFPV